MIVMRECGNEDSPALIAGVLHHNYTRGTDDVTVPAVKPDGVKP
jgi:hypothetical protein